MNFGHDYIVFFVRWEGTEEVIFRWVFRLDLFLVDELLYDLMEGKNVGCERKFLANEFVKVGDRRRVNGEAILVVLANPLRKELAKWGWQRG